MSLQTDKKFAFIKTQLGSRQAYSNTIKQGNFSTSEIEILLQASANINSSEINQELIYEAYDVLHSKNLYKENKSSAESSLVRPKVVKNNRLMKCPNCKKSISKNANSCPNCKLLLDTEKNNYLTTCYKCGCKVYKTEKKCPNCGANLQKLKSIMITALIITIIYILFDLLNK